MFQLEQRPIGQPRMTEASCSARGDIVPDSSNFRVTVKEIKAQRGLRRRHYVGQPRPPRSPLHSTPLTLANDTVFWCLLGSTLNCDL